MKLATGRVSAIFLVGGTGTTCLVMWMTMRVLFLVQDPPIPYEDVLFPWFGAPVLTLVWAFPGLLLAATLAALYFSFFKRIPLWLVLLALIPVCGLFATYQNISDSRYLINKSDRWKLMYWLLVTSPGQLLCARIVASKSDYR
ncbi:hypothetical protein [Bradyrhizobium sp.]|uniref:hypothetical protein n=1 Tax=Bradyrhizobium sp. TaxID=376 RepID=UPI003C1CDE96